MRVLMVLLAVLLPSLASASKYLDADNVDEAIVMAEMDARGIEAMRQFCATDVPGMQGNVDAHTFLWQVNNQAELRALRAAMLNDSKAWLHGSSAPVDALLAPLRVLPPEKRLAYCVGHMASIKGGDRDIARRTPAVSRLLAGYLLQHPLPTGEVRWLDDKTGCMKQAFNTNLKAGGAFDLRQADRRCDCMATVMRKQISDEDRKQLDQQIRTGASPAQSPLMQGIAPQLGRCMQS
jgi:hypothetical protein